MGESPISRILLRTGMKARLCFVGVTAIPVFQCVANRNRAEGGGMARGGPEGGAESRSAARGDARPEGRGLGGRRHCIFWSLIAF
jgi:hypothetical protein